MEDSKWVTLNVGGEIFTTTRSTLTTREPNSMLARMFNTDQPIKSDRDAQGAHLIDRNGRYFGTILDYLRHGSLVYDKHISLAGISMEAEFYGIEGMMQLIEEEKEKETVLTRNDVCRMLASLGNVNFSHACLRGCDFTEIYPVDKKSFFYSCHVVSCCSMGDCWDCCWNDMAKI